MRVPLKYVSGPWFATRAVKRVRLLLLISPGSVSAAVFLLHAVAGACWIRSPVLSLLGLVAVACWMTFSFYCSSCLCKKLGGRKNVREFIWNVFRFLIL
jgi:hypothetical protein